MKGNARYYFPGNNTPGGFFSYYHYLTNQNGTGKVWYLKGGPGTGKSTFVKKIGESLLNKGYDVDFLTCSSDSESLDGIKLRNYEIAVVDATPPHSMDPIYPGAVEVIVDLSRYWNEEGIRKNREEIVAIRKSISEFYKKAYNHLGAAEKMYDILALDGNKRIAKTTSHKIANNILKDCLANGKILSKESNVRQFFASAITPQGVKNHLENLVSGCKKVYVIRSKTAWNSQIILDNIYGCLIGHGYDVELFFCPMKPGTKIEHIIVPELSFAVISSNEYHEFPSACIEIRKEREIIDIEIIQGGDVDSNNDETNCKNLMADHIDKAIFWLGEAKGFHDRLEEFYIPNMDFDAMAKLREAVEDEICSLL